MVVTKSLTVTILHSSLSSAPGIQRAQGLFKVSANWAYLSVYTVGFYRERAGSDARLPYPVRCQILNTTT